jgi:hypothetical protein
MLGNRVKKSPSVILAVRGRLLPEFGGFSKRRAEGTIFCVLRTSLVLDFRHSTRLLFFFTASLGGALGRG